MFFSTNNAAQFLALKSNLEKNITWFKVCLGVNEMMYLPYKICSKMHCDTGVDKLTYTYTHIGI